jgi:hypothetical protein
MSTTYIDNSGAGVLKIGAVMDNLVDLLEADGVQCPEPGGARTCKVDLKGGGKNKTSVSPEHRCMGRKWGDDGEGKQCSKKRVGGTDFCVRCNKPCTKYNGRYCKKLDMINFLEEYDVQCSMDMTGKHLKQLCKATVNNYDIRQYEWFRGVDEEAPMGRWRSPSWFLEDVYTLSESDIVASKTITMRIFPQSKAEERRVKRRYTNNGGWNWNLDLGMRGTINGTTWKVVAR